MFEAEFSQGAMEEGMRKTMPQDRNWTQQAGWHRKATGRRTFQIHQAVDAASEPDDWFWDKWQAET